MKYAYKLLWFCTLHEKTKKSIKNQITNNILILYVVWLLSFISAFFVRVYNPPEFGLGCRLEILWSDRQVGVSLDPTVGVHVAGWPAAVHSFAVLATNKKRSKEGLKYCFCRILNLKREKLAEEITKSIAVHVRRRSNCQGERKITVIMKKYFIVTVPTNFNNATRVQET